MEQLRALWLGCRAAEAVLAGQGRQMHACLGSERGLICARWDSWVVVRRVVMVSISATAATAVSKQQLLSRAAAREAWRTAADGLRLSCSMP